MVLATMNDDNASVDSDFANFMSFVKAPNSTPAPAAKKTPTRKMMAPSDNSSTASSSGSESSGFANFMSFAKSPEKTKAPPKKINTTTTRAVSGIPRQVIASPVAQSNSRDSMSTDDSDFGDFMNFVSDKKSAPKAAAAAVPKPVVKKAAPVKKPASARAIPAKAPSVRKAAAAPVAKKAAPAPVKKAAPTHVKALSQKAEPTKAAPKPVPAAPVVAAAGVTKKANEPSKEAEPLVRSPTANTMASTVNPAASMGSSSESEWSEQSDRVVEHRDTVSATAGAPTMKAKSIGRGQLTSDNSVGEIESVASPAAPSASRSAPAQQKPKPAPRALPAKSSFELPKTASAANVHFAEEDVKKALEIEAARAITQQKEPMEPLPVDHFTKEGNAYLAAKAESMRQLADAEMPIGIRYFTELGEEEKAKKFEEIRLLSEAEMSAATLHFKRLEEEKRANAVAEEPDAMPAAIQKFTLEAREVQDKKAAEIQALHDNPPPMPEGQAYFTTKMRAELERQKSEIEALKNNPPPASVATEYFKVKQSERQLEIETMMNEPAPPAIHYFTEKAKEEEARNKAAMERASKSTGETSAATKHFVAMESQRKLEIEAARAITQEKEPMEPLPVDYFTNQGNEYLAAKAQAQKDLADAEMPIGIRYFTELGEQEKAKKYEEIRLLSEAEMSVSTRHFKALAEEKAANPADGEGDIMPAAIQKFTMEARAEQEKKRKELDELRENPPPMPEGQAYFTNKMRVELERQQAEIQDMIDNPPPASVATEYFKVKESQRQLEIEAMMNEPAPPAIQYFTEKAKEEEERNKAAMERASMSTGETSAATKHFVQKESQRQLEIEALRQEVWKVRGQQKEDVPGINWASLTKQKAPAVPTY